jgi:Na+-translocating ferredoxin:NAD+ oxidoreductase subunit G
MAKKESTFLNMVLTLFVVTLVASTALGFVFEGTKGPIEEAKMQQKRDAIREVVPEFDNSPLDFQKSVDVPGGKVTTYEASKNGELTGVAIESFTNKGFSGNIKIMVGFTPDGNIHDISVLEHKETPGLGDKMEKSKSGFSEQFKGKNLSGFIAKVRQDGGNIDAITAATISSRAYCDAVERAYKVFNQEFSEK